MTVLRPAGRLVVTGAVVAATAAGCADSGLVASYPVKGSNAVVTLDPRLVSKLADDGVTVAPVGRAVATGPGAFTFPITGGTVKAGSLAGRYQAAGGLRFTNAAGTSVTLDDPLMQSANWIVTAKVDGKDEEWLSGAVSVPVTSGNTNLSFIGAQETLSADLAKELNTKLGVSDFDNTVVGSLTIHTDVNP